MKYLLLGILGCAQVAVAEIHAARLLYGLSYGAMYGTLCGTKLFFCGIERRYSLRIFYHLLEHCDPKNSALESYYHAKAMALCFGLAVVGGFIEEKLCHQYWPKWRDRTIPNCANKVYDWGMKIPYL